MADTPDLVARWRDYVESMGSAMGEAEELAQQMASHIEALEAENARLKALYEHVIVSWGEDIIRTPTIRAEALMDAAWAFDDDMTAIQAREAILALIEKDKK